jgi:hypothetical protein
VETSTDSLILCASMQPLDLTGKIGHRQKVDIMNALIKHTLGRQPDTDYVYAWMYSTPDELNELWGFVNLLIAQLTPVFNFPKLLARLAEGNDRLEVVVV